MIPKSLGTIRRENLEYLLKLQSGTQEILSAKIGHSNLTQPIISSILRGKRAFHESEVRFIETKLGIPLGWMDHDNSLSLGWEIIEAYQSMSANNKETFNRAVEFVLSWKKSIL